MPLGTNLEIGLPKNVIWWGSNKKYVWLKGTILKVNDNSVEISLRKSNGVNRCMCLGDNLNYIYKQL